MNINEASCEHSGLRSLWYVVKSRSGDFYTLYRDVYPFNIHIAVKVPKNTGFSYEYRLLRIWTREDALLTLNVIRGPSLSHVEDVYMFDFLGNRRLV